MAVLMGVHYPTGQLEQRTNQQCGLTHGTSSHFRWELCFLGGGAGMRGEEPKGPALRMYPRPVGEASPPSLKLDALLVS